MAKTIVIIGCSYQGAHIGPWENEHREQLLNRLWQAVEDGSVFKELELEITRTAKSRCIWDRVLGLNPIPHAFICAVEVDSGLLDETVLGHLPFIEIEGIVDKVTVAGILRNPGYLYKMSPANFECFVGELYRGLGYRVTMTNLTRDGGVDLFVEKKINGMLHRYAVQCKHTKQSRKAGVAYARELLGVFADKAVTACILITNSLFSKDTLRFINRHQHRIFAVDLSRLQELMAEYIVTMSVRRTLVLT